MSLIIKSFKGGFNIIPSLLTLRQLIGKINKNLKYK